MRGVSSRRPPPARPHPGKKSPVPPAATAETWTGSATVGVGVGVCCSSPTTSSEGSLTLGRCLYGGDLGAQEGEARVGELRMPDGRPRVNVGLQQQTEVDMAPSDQKTALSDKLAELSARAKEAEGRAVAARDQSKADLQSDAETARAGAQARAKKLRESAEANKNKLSVWWYDLQRTWNEHVAKVRDDIDTKRAEHDVDRAERRAEHRADDAVFAVEFAYSAIEEAEYAVLDAELARKEADELSAA